MADAGADQYTFHLEATDDVVGCIRKIKEAGMKVHNTAVVTSVLKYVFVIKFCSKVCSTILINAKLYILQQKQHHRILRYYIQMVFVWCWFMFVQIVPLVFSPK